MKILLYIVLYLFRCQISLPQKREMLNLTLFSIFGAEENFPVDEWGVFTLPFKNTQYEFQTYILNTVSISLTTSSLAQASSR